MKCSFNICILLLSAIPLGICEKARPVNTGSQNHVSKTVKNAENNHHLNFVPVYYACTQNRLQSGSSKKCFNNINIIRSLSNYFYSTVLSDCDKHPVYRHYEAGNIVQIKFHIQL